MKLLLVKNYFIIGTYKSEIIEKNIETDLTGLLTLFLTVWWGGGSKLHQSQNEKTYKHWQGLVVLSLHGNPFAFYIFLKNWGIPQM